jgi:ABC-type lipoprotein release transport system permease subunit
MRSVVFGVTTHDPVTFVVLPIAVMTIALAAAYFPARRAARVDPVTTMRAE